MLKRNFLWGFTTILLLIFVACENGVYFTPSELPTQPGNGDGLENPIQFTAELTNKGTGYGFSGSDGNYEIGYVDLTEVSSTETKTVSIELSLENLHETLPITVGYAPLVVENSDTENPDTENPDTENSDTENSDAENPDTENPDVENPNPVSFISNLTFNDLNYEAVAITSDTSTVRITVDLASNPSIDQEGSLIIKFTDDSGNTYDTENSPKEIKIAIKRNKYEKIELGDPIKFTAKVTSLGTDYLFEDGKIVYTDLTEASAIEAKTVSIELALENLHKTFPITVQYTETDEKGFIGEPTFVGYTAIPKLYATIPKLQITIPLASNKDIDQEGIITLKFSDGSGVIYDAENSPKEIQIPIKRNKYAPPEPNSLKFTATMKKIEGADFSFNELEGNYEIEYTDTLETSTQEKTVSVDLTLAGLHPDAFIKVDNTIVNDAVGFISNLVFDNIASQAAPTLNIDIPLAHSSTDQEGTITLQFTPSKTDIYTADSPKEIKISVKRNRYIAPATVTLDFAGTMPVWATVNTADLNLPEPKVSITDNEGKGFGSSFNLIAFPDIETIPLENRNVKVTIGDYTPTTGTGDFLDLHFCPTQDCYCFSKSKTSTFKPDGGNSKLRVDFLPTFATQAGTLAITLEYDENTYKDAPKQVTLNIRSNGTKKTITVGTLTEQSDDTAVGITGNTNNYDLTIKDPDKASTNEAEYEIPLQISNLIGVLDDYPVTITAKDSNKLTVENIKRNQETITFTATHLGIEKFQATEGSVILTIDSVHNEVYNDLPRDIVINTKRDESFKYYIADYANEFTVSASTENLIDNGKYYTEVRIPGMSNSGTAKLSYVISRKDDRNGDFKGLDTRTISANTGFEYKDHNAFILRTEPQYKIIVTHVGCSNAEPCTSEIVRTGSRMLTDRELFLAAMDSMRYALIDKEAHNLSGIADTSRETKSANGGKFHHYYDYRGIISWKFYPYSYIHTYTISTYKPHFLTLDGKFTYASDDTTHKSINTVWDNGHHEKAPFTGTVNFTSSYGNGSITFNKINIHNYDWADPNWDSTLTVKVGDRTVTYKKGDVPFGFYMNSGRFLEVTNAANYTQK